MAKTIEELRAHLNKTDERKTTNLDNNSIYPFWNIPVDQPAVLRFLPDADDDNPTFWRERIMINLTFDGIVGNDDHPNKEVKLQIPCMETWGQRCPVLDEVRRYFKEGHNELGKKYWKKRSFLFQGFVRKNPLANDVVPDNPIRRFVINKTLFDIIRDSVMSDDMDVLPTDFDDGIDFYIKRTKTGEYSNYSTSAWSRKSSPLQDDEVKALEEYGLFDLKDFLPKKPDEESMRVMMEMFEASVDGEPYDPERWAAYYKPFILDLADNDKSSGGSKSESTSTKKKAPSAKKAKEVEPDEDEDMEEQEESKTSKSSKSNSGDQVKDLLAKLNKAKEKSA